MLRKLSIASLLFNIIAELRFDLVGIELSQTALNDDGGNHNADGIQTDIIFGVALNSEINVGAEFSRKSISHDQFEFYKTSYGIHADYRFP